MALGSAPVGPKPLPKINLAAGTVWQVARWLMCVGAGDFGGNLLMGEGAAMAHFVEENKRIPRRGEVRKQAIMNDQLSVCVGWFDIGTN